MLAERTADGMDTAGAGDPRSKLTGQSLVQNTCGGIALMPAAGQLIPQ